MPPRRRGSEPWRRFLGWLVKEKQITPHIPVWDKSERTDGTFSRWDFTFDRKHTLPAHFVSCCHRLKLWRT